MMSWNQRYYDALEFFFWEPQHLGKMRNIESYLKTPDSVKCHLRKMEVTLNHQLDFFFELAPDSLHRKIFSAFFGKAVPGKLVHFGRDVESHFDFPVNTTQPDLFFMGDESVVSIELKAKSKCNIEQALKYSLLGLAADVISKREHQQYLGFIAPGKFSDIWKENINSPDELRERMLEAIPSLKYRKLGNMDIFEQRPKLIRLIEDISLGYMSYGELAELLQEEANEIEDASPAAVVYRNLLMGMAKELVSDGRKR